LVEKIAGGAAVAASAVWAVNALITQEHIGMGLNILLNIVTIVGLIVKHKLDKEKQAETVKTAKELKVQVAENTALTQVAAEMAAEASGKDVNEVVDRTDVMFRELMSKYRIHEDMANEEVNKPRGS
jgi:hypothetical protein